MYYTTLWLPTYHKSIQRNVLSYRLFYFHTSKHLLPGIQIETHPDPRSLQERYPQINHHRILLQFLQQPLLPAQYQYHHLPLRLRALPQDRAQPRPGQEPGKGGPEGQSRRC